MPTILVDTSTDGDTLVAAPGAGKFIRIVGCDLTSNGAVTVSLKSNTTTKWKTYATTNAGGGAVLPLDESRDLDCDLNEPLKIGLSAVVAVAGSLTYAIKG